jgi:hypothetical protein
MTLLEVLSLLHGRWLGTGRGGYPTIQPFEFAEETTFVLALEYPLLRYEQRTVLLPDRKSSHWEVGFLRPTDDGLLEISNAQDGGRVEVLRGSYSITADPPVRVRLALRSKIIANDPRMLETERVITVRGDVLHYENYMVTTTTERPVREKHLEAWLRRAEATA